MDNGQKTDKFPRYGTGSSGDGRAPSTGMAGIYFMCDDLIVKEERKEQKGLTDAGAALMLVITWGLKSKIRRYFPCDRKSDYNRCMCPDCFHNLPQVCEVFYHLVHSG